MNAYADVATLKSSEYADLTQNTEQVRFRRLLESASQYLDKRCERWFYCKEETRHFDGGSNLIFLDDILSVTTFKLDEDGDGTYEASLTENTDYALYPLNEYPKSWAEILSQGDYGNFAGGVKRGVEIVAVWGYGDGWSATPYRDSGDDVADTGGINATVTTVTVTDADNFGPGQTIRMESEQCYIEQYDTSLNTLTIKRGVNGTTAATHAQNVDIYIYDYPMPIYQATLMLAMRAWKRKDSSFQDAVGSPETGLVVTFKDEDPGVKKIIDRYRRRV